MDNQTEKKLEEAISKSPVYTNPTSRAEFLKTLLAVGALGAVSGTLGSCSVPTREPSKTWDGKKRRWGMVIDTRKCINCKACTVACKAENNTPPGVAYTVVMEQPEAETDKLTFFSKPCFHCEHPPCVPVCPTGATYKRTEDGIVVMDYDVCIGCRYCVTACPYGSRYADFGDIYDTVDAANKYDLPSVEYNEFRPTEGSKSTHGVVRKCNFCIHMQNEKGEYTDTPACVKSCVGHALNFGDFNDPDSNVSQLLQKHPHIRLKEELGTEPNVYYIL